MNMFKLNKVILALVIILSINVSFFAQGQEASVEPLRVGSKLPESFWQKEHTIYQEGRTIKKTLESQRGKLLILDFWATWCGSCINKFRTLEKLQTQFSNDISIILTNTQSTRDDEQKIHQLLSGIKYGSEPYRLTTIYNDNYINKLFPHGYMPFYVIISPSGEVRAIIPAELVNVENIKLMLDIYKFKTRKK